MTAMTPTPDECVSTCTGPRGIRSLAPGPKIEISGNWGQMRKSADEHEDHPKVFDEEAEV